LGLSDLHTIISRAADGAGGRGAGGDASSDSIPAEPTLVPETGVDTGAEPPRAARALNLTVIGRPNVGKSTLINALVGSERVLTGPEPGITRDAIVVPWRYKQRDIRLFDTAGIRRRARVTDRLERLSVTDALRAIRYAEVVVLLLDATRPFDKQDLQLADLVEREGRAPVIAVNKWDLVPERKRALQDLREAAERLLPQLRGVPLVPVSALKGTGVPALMRAVFAAEKLWNTRVPTPRLNRWLDEVGARHPPPAASGRRLKLRYITQAKTRPPGFVLFCSRPNALPADYRRYLVNSLREDFGLEGVPIRLHVRGGDNPYARRKR
jgi:GTP-binding protein